MCFLGNCMVHFICVLCPRPFIISDGGDPVKEKISLIVLRDAPGSSQLMQASGNDWIEQERSSGFPGITDIMTPVFTANFDISMRLARAMKSPWNLHQVWYSTIELSQVVTIRSREERAHCGATHEGPQTVHEVSENAACPKSPVENTVINYDKLINHRI